MLEAAGFWNQSLVCEEAGIQRQVMVILSKHTAVSNADEMCLDFSLQARYLPHNSFQSLRL